MNALQSFLCQSLARRATRKRPRVWSTAAFSSSSLSTVIETCDNTSDDESSSRRKPPTSPQQQPSIEAKELYRYLGLETFSDIEFQSVAQRIQRADLVDSSLRTKDEEDKPHENATEQDDSSVLTPEQITKFLETKIAHLEKENGYGSNHDEKTATSMRQNFAAVEARRCWDFLLRNIPAKSSSSMQTLGQDQMTSKEFCSALKKSATALDTKRILPMTMSMVLVGSSVGVVTPAMPFVVQELGLTAGEYGLVVSAFALSKMAGNIPSAVLVERHGRKPYLVYSMAAIALGVGGIGLATSFEHLYLCRLATGMGVASLSAAVTMTVTDISTPLNRASSFAPVMSAFAAGTALGPALGGILCDQIGIHPTFYVVGVSYFGLAAVNNILLSETQPKPVVFPWQQKPDSAEQPPSIAESFQAALGQWVPLLSMPPVRNVCIMNGFYWMGLAGSQMTLLPLILTNADGLAMSATSVGQVYMGMSLVQVLGNPILAKVVDRAGKVPGIVGGCTLISSAMATLPFCQNGYQMAGVFAVWATGSSLLSTAPISYISDKVDDKGRAQAIALLRTSGDVGFLVGASSMGALADWVGSLEVAMQSSSGILMAATSWFALRNILSVQLEKTNKQSS